MELTCCAVRKCIGVQKGFKMYVLPLLECSGNEIYTKIFKQKDYIVIITFIPRLKYFK